MLPPVGAIPGADLVNALKKIDALTALIRSQKGVGYF